jgi:NAD(P)-dependent dehydrogenase (short-subunit alcohol dehydrogenase family)
MLKKTSIQDKVVLVTGGNRGIGKEIVIQLLESGAQKVYSGVRSEGSMSDLVEKYGARIEEITLDVTSEESIALANSKIPTLDILINNAGVIPMGNFSNGNSLETLDANWNVNVRGLVAVTQAFFNKVSASDNGAIVSMSSISGLGNMAFMGTYSASKSAVHSLMQGLRTELKDQSVLVSTVYPGPVDTEMTAGFEVEKASPQSVAIAIINGINEGSEEIFPDEMSRNLGPLYFSDPKELEKQFSAF